MSYFSTENPQECYGCRACEQICPTNAIQMTANTEGFLYPSIETNKCIHCGKCEQHCPAVQDDLLIKNSYTGEAFGAINNNDIDLRKSSSGGVFSALASQILSQDGFVSGCIFDDKMRAKHILSSCEDDIDKMRGSKYIQSDTMQIYTKIEEYLKTGKQILFTGTPCQVAGLQSFLNHPYDNLVTMDFVCHGVPSQKLFSTYIQYLEKKEKGQIIDYHFRDKTKYGWSTTGSYLLRKKDGKENRKYLFTSEDAYYSLFLSEKTYRESCYHCPYACKIRQSDLTVGDFWGIEKQYPNIVTTNGVSLVLANTQKGKNLLQSILGSITAFPTDIDFVAENNGNLRHCSQRNTVRDKIYKDIEQFGFQKGSRRYWHASRIMPRIKRMLPTRVKRAIKKMFVP